MTKDEKIKQLEQENDLLKRQIKAISRTWYGVIGHMSLHLDDER